MVSEDRVKLRVSYSGTELYESLVAIPGVIREEYVDSYDVEGETEDEAVMFTCDIVYDSDSVSELSVVGSVREIDGVESAQRNADL